MVPSFIKSAENASAVISELLQHTHKGKCCFCSSNVLISATQNNHGNYGNNVFCPSGEATEEEKNLSRTLMKYWANFARNG